MTSSPRRRVRGALIRIAAGTAGSPHRVAAAQAFPSKPITLVLPFPPGGSFDPIFRALCDRGAAGPWPADRADAQAGRRRRDRHREPGDDERGRRLHRSR